MKGKYRYISSHGQTGWKVTLCPSEEESTPVLKRICKKFSKNDQFLLCSDTTHNYRKG